MYSNRFTVFVDGFCKGNHQADPEARQGGYRLRKCIGVVGSPTRLARKKSRLEVADLPQVQTSNEAEFEAMIIALNSLNALPAGSHVVLKSDSKLVLGSVAHFQPDYLVNPQDVQYSGKFPTIKAENLRPLENKLLAALANLRNITVSFVWVPRKTMVEATGG